VRDVKTGLSRRRAVDGEGTSMGSTALARSTPVMHAELRAPVIEVVSACRSLDVCR
jgi:hypothetical protein